MFIKRLLDIIISSITLIILSPLMLVISIMIYFKLGSPIFFIHERVGKDFKPFKLIKFRSMKNARNEKGELLPDDERLTNFGKWLRSTSVDEIPELINILKGEMSLIGPRPLIAEYIPLYSERQLRRHRVLPGLSGWAQINGRNNITWGQKLEMDIWYIENWSLLLDIKIMFKTISKVIKREDINSVGGVTSTRFNGFN